MTTVAHPDILELAAAAIDFELSREERETLDTHVEWCVACRRQAIALRSDQAGLASLPLIAPSPSQSARLCDAIVRPSKPAVSAVRMALLAAALALLALAAIGVGARLITPKPDGQLTVAPTDRDSSSVTAPDASVSPSGQPGLLTVGSVADVVVPDLRVRTAPTTDNSKSVKLDPLLGLGVRLQILDGPVTADGYDWYLVQAIDLPHRGWVAASDHDGTPWIEAHRDAPAGAAPMTSTEQVLFDALRRDARVGCQARRRELPAGATVAIECAIESDLVSRVGVYRFPTRRDATTAYFERLASYDVAPATGDCRVGVPGDRPWSAPDGTTTDGLDKPVGGPWSLGRTGCFLDQNEAANTRITCGRAYIGVVGRTRSILDLYRWTWAPSNVSSDGAGRPGICGSLE